MEPVTSARGLAEMDFREGGEQQKIRLTYSNTSGIIQAGPAPEALIVCIIQVQGLPGSREGRKPEGETGERQTV
jgi:hypothetical protein